MGSNTPEAPDLGPQAAATERQAELAYQTGQEQLAWSREQWDKQEALLERILGPQTRIMEEQWAAGKEDRARYKKVYQGLEDDLVQEFQEYDNPFRRKLERGRAMATVQQTYDAQRENAVRQLTGMGIDPSQVRSGAIDTNARNVMAAQQAAQANLAEQRIENTGRALRSEALNIGKGYPGQVAGSYAGAINAGNSAMSNMNSTVQTGANTMGTGQSWGSQGLQASQQGVNIANSGFQNQMQAAEMANANSPLAMVGDLAGTALGVWGSTGFMNEGGKVPEDIGGRGPGTSPPPPQALGVDRHPVLLADDEYIIPADVMKWKGQEFFEKLTTKSREGKAEIDNPGQQQQQALPVGG